MARYIKRYCVLKKLKGGTVNVTRSDGTKFVATIIDPLPNRSIINETDLLLVTKDERASEVFWKKSDLRGHNLPGRWKYGWYVSEKIDGTICAGNFNVSKVGMKYPPRKKKELCKPAMKAEDFMVMTVGEFISRVASVLDKYEDA